MSDISSSLMLNKLIFDKIEFTRKGFKNNEEISFEMEVQIGAKEDGSYRVTLILKGVKEREYDFQISLTGFFMFKSSEQLDEKDKEGLIHTNAIAILMPYLRSEVSLLTAQPDTECVVLPPFNINKLLSDDDERM